MSVRNTLDALGELLASTDATPEPPIASVLVDPRAAVNLGDFPTLLLTLTPGREHAWREEAFGLMRHEFSVTGYLFLGSTEATPLEELHQRAVSWAEPIATSLVTALTLGGSVYFLGDGDAGNTLFTYKIGPMDWGEGKYFGLIFTLPVAEKIRMEMNP